MKLDTKYDIGQKVYICLYESGVIPVATGEILDLLLTRNNKTRYLIEVVLENGMRITRRVEESEVYATSEEAEAAAERQRIKQREASLHLYESERNKLVKEIQDKSARLAEVNKAMIKLNAELKPEAEE